MGTTAISCYLVDGHGMELLLRRQHPARAGRPGGPWSLLNERGGVHSESRDEVCLFGLPAGHEASALPSLAGLALRVLPEALSGFAAWVKRDARRRREPVRYCLASDDPELRRQARELGVELLDQAGLLRQLGLLARAAALAAQARAATPREPSMLKGGKVMSPAELEWWCGQLGVEGGDGEEEPAPIRAPAADGVSAPPAAPAVAGAPADPELARFARWMGAEPDDPRILRHEQEDWEQRHFPEGGPPAAPSPQEPPAAPAKRSDRRGQGR